MAEARWTAGAAGGVSPTAHRVAPADPSESGRASPAREGVPPEERAGSGKQLSEDEWMGWLALLLRQEIERRSG
jgi:hypothetical protein